VIPRQHPRFLHALTAVHALGAIACGVLAVGSAASDDFRDGLAMTGGSRLMVSMFGDWTWLFLAFVGVTLGVLAYVSWRVRPVAWSMTLAVYGIGVAGSLWQVSVGIPQGWVAAAVNAAVVLYTSRPAIRRAYTRR
jgi:hypothetical protein